MRAANGCVAVTGVLRINQREEIGFGSFAAPGNIERGRTVTTLYYITRFDEGTLLGLLRSRRHFLLGTF
jgi:hypothetical protein